MKKLLAIAVACIYLAITSGLVLQVHYCMGKLSGASVSMAASGDHACAVCGMKNGKNKCCHDDVKFIKLQDVHKQVSSDYQFTPPVGATQEFNLICPAPCLPCSPASTDNNSPPDDDAGDPPLFLLHNVFRI